MPLARIYDYVDPRAEGIHFRMRHGDTTVRCLATREAIIILANLGDCGLFEMTQAFFGHRSQFEALADKKFEAGAMTRGIVVVASQDIKLRQTAVA